MSRSSSERVSKDEELMQEFFKEFDNYFIETALGKNAYENYRSQVAVWWLSKLEAYADQKIKQMFEEENNRNEGDRFMPCFKCKREFEWNGKDKGELIRVRGGGMWCKKCLEVK